MIDSNTPLIEVNPGRYRQATPAEAARLAAARQATRPPRLSLNCIHLGEVTGEERRCPSCRGEVRVKLQACVVHGRCTTAKKVDGVACCIGCPDKQSAGLVKPVVRNLLYHVYPISGPAWRWNVAQLRHRLDLFNGRRIVAVVTDHRTDHPDEVRRAFGDSIDELFVVPNDPALREVATFETLLGKVKTLHPAHVTFYAHTKGVSRDMAGTVKPWAEILYAANLDCWHKVERLLEKYPLAGAFKKLGRGWPDHESPGSQWHYSGSFYWFRNRDVFSQPDWARIDRFWGGVEPWPSLHFTAAQAGCIFHEDTVPVMNLYDGNYMNKVVLPALEKWKSPGMSGQNLKVELGGGKTPRGDGYINVDVLTVPGVDHVVDFEAQDLHLPFEDESVASLYSSHCLEHVYPIHQVLHEIVRVCRLGSEVEIRVPHWLGALASIAGHKHVVCERQLQRICGVDAGHWWQGCTRKLSLRSAVYVPETTFAELRPLFPQMTDEQVLKYIPDACHEVIYMFEVVPHEQ